MAAMDTRRAGAIILAAGASRRLGQPKQLLPWRNGRPLLLHAIDMAREAGFSPICVVLGSSEGRCRELLSGEEVLIVKNSDWDSGMGSSIAVGVSALKDSTDRIVVMLCDQPLVPSWHLAKLDEMYRVSGEIVATGLGGDAAGPPVLFPHRFFGELMKLKGEKGARSLIDGSSSAITVDCPLAAFDVDTTAALEFCQKEASGEH